MLKIWGRRNAFNVQKVMWLVGELDLPHEHISAGGNFGGLTSIEFLAMNPCGHIPVIKDEKIIVWESHAILRYIAAIFGKEKFWTYSAAERSLDDRWMDWAQTSLQPDFLNGIFWAFYRTPEDQRDWSFIRKSIEKCKAHFELLDKILMKQPFLSGKELGLADIPAGTALYRYFELDIERPQVPNVIAWYERLKDRPAYREHVMVPFSDMKGRLK